MTNLLCVLLYSPLLICNLIMLPAAVRSGPVAVRKPFILFSVSLLCWQVCEALYYVLRDADAVRYVFDLKLGFIAYCAVFLFWLVAAYYRLDRRFPKHLMHWLLLLPTVVTILTIAGPWHSLFLRDFTVTSMAPLTTNIMHRAPAFFVIWGYCILLFAGIAVMIIRATRNLPSAYRQGARFFYLGMLLCAAGILAENIHLDLYSTIDFNLVGVSLAGIFIYLATLTGGNADYQSLRKNEVFNFLDQAIFILNREGRIVEENLPAKRLMSLLGRHGPRNEDFFRMLDGLAAGGSLVRKRQENQKDSDLYVLTSSYPAVYSMRTQPFFDREGEFGGRLVILEDITNKRLFLDRLRQTAGVDALTGLPNRYRYQELLRELDTAGNLPFSVILGDVNGLKAVNDRYGHYEGDLLLKTMADVLRRCCPDRGYVTRIGGDEFVLLLPGCGGKQAAEVSARIQREVVKAGLPFDASIALGWATKTEPGMNLSVSIDEADRNMYRRKEAK